VSSPKLRNIKTDFDDILHWGSLHDLSKVMFAYFLLINYQHLNHFSDSFSNSILETFIRSCHAILIFSCRITHNNVHFTYGYKGAFHVYHTIVIKFYKQTIDKLRMLQRTSFRILCSMCCSTPFPALFINVT
jgi:hypothetical protein